MGCVNTKHGSRSASNSTLDQADRQDLPKIFHPKCYAELLETAVREENQELCIKCLQEIDCDQRRLVVEAYNAETERNLHLDCHNKLDPVIAFGIELLSHPRMVLVATQLEADLHNSDIRQQNIIEIIVSTSLRQKNGKLKEAYVRLFDRKLEDDVSAKCAPEVKDVLLAFLHDPRAERRFSTTQFRAVSMHKKSFSDMFDSGEVAIELLDAAEGQDLFEGEEKFYSVMTSYSVHQLKDILETFLKKSQRDMTTEIEKAFPEGDKRVNLKTLVTMIRIPWIHYSHRVHELLHSSYEEDMKDLLYIVLTQKDDGIRKLKKAYQSIFLNQLSLDIRREIENPLVQRMLIKAVK